LPPPDPSSAPTHLQAGGGTIRLTPTPATAAAAPRRRRPMLLVLVCLVLFAATFGAAYGVTTLVR
jgi:hypothetical protein